MSASEEAAVDEAFKGWVHERITKAPDLESAVMNSIGAASVCWSQLPAGVFDSEKAEILGRELLEYIKEKYHSASSGQSLAAGQDWDSTTGWKFGKDKP